MRKSLQFALICLMLLTIVSCGKNDDQSFNTSDSLGHPSEYFPTAISAIWEYEITVTENKALNYKEVAWPLGNGKASIVSVRGFFVSQLRDTVTTKYKLMYQITGAPEIQGMFKYENARQLKIMVDEFGIYDNCKELFWLISPGNEYQIQEVCTYDPNSVGAPRTSWGGWNQADGNAYHLIFMGTSPGTSIGISESPETLAFIGLEDGVLHFRRTVEGREDDASSLSKTFQEDTWYAKGKGLVKLVQKVEGKITMTWVLKNK